MANSTLFKITHFIGLLFILLLTQACGDSQEKSGKSFEEGKYFQGEINFKIEYKPKYSDISKEEIENVYGTASKLVFKDGNFKISYISPQGLLVKEYFLDLEKNRAYSYFINTDTVNWYDISQHLPYEVSRSSTSDTIIRGLECFKVTSHARVNDTSRHIFEVDYISYYARKLRINPEWYKNFKVENYYELAKMVQSLRIEEYSSMPECESYQNCESIVWRKVDDKELSLDHLSSKVFIEY